MPTASLYDYSPSIAAACVASIVFVLATIAAWYFFIKLKTWVLFAFIFGVMLEAASLTARAFSSTHKDHINPFILATFLPVAAPSFLAAGVFMVFGRIVWYTIPTDMLTFKKLWMFPRFATLFFIALDMLAFAIMILGIAHIGTAYESADKIDKDKLSVGLNTMRLGLGLQILCFGAFALICMRFLIVTRLWFRGRALQLPGTTKQLKLLLISTIFAALLLLGSTIFRVYEFAHRIGGESDSYVLTHEWPYWAFDALPMLFICVMYTAVHPGRILPKQFINWRLSKRTVADFRQTEPKGWPAEPTLPTHEGKNGFDVDGHEIPLAQPAPTARKSRWFG